MKRGMIYGISALLLAANLTISCKKDNNNNGDMLSLSGSASGANEVPAVATNATGNVSGTYNRQTNMLTYNITWTGLSGNATVAHFHGPALPGESASPVIALAIVSPNANGRASGSATLTDAQETDLLAGKWYFNVHTAAHPNGEIRAQIAANGTSSGSGGGGGY